MREGAGGDGSMCAVWEIFRTIVLTIVSERRAARRVDC